MSIARIMSKNTYAEFEADWSSGCVSDFFSRCEVDVIFTELRRDEFFEKHRSLRGGQV